jgi:hypothetical protein
VGEFAHTCDAEATSNLPWVIRLRSEFFRRVSSKTLLDRKTTVFWSKNQASGERDRTFIQYPLKELLRQYNCPKKTKVLQAFKMRVKALLFSKKYIKIPLSETISRRYSTTSITFSSLIIL